MSKDYFVLNAGRVVYAPGHYDLEGAERVAKGEAQRHPGRTYRIVRLVDAYQFEKPKKT